MRIRTALYISNLTTTSFQGVTMPTTPSIKCLYDHMKSTWAISTSSLHPLGQLNSLIAIVRQVSASQVSSVGFSLSEWYVSLSVLSLILCTLFHSTLPTSCLLSGMQKCLIRHRMTRAHGPGLSCRMIYRNSIEEQSLLQRRTYLDLLTDHLAILLRRSLVATKLGNISCIYLS